MKYPLLYVYFSLIGVLVFLFLFTLWGGPKISPTIPQQSEDAGLVTTGLIAEYRFEECLNLLNYSERFDNFAWTKTRSTISPNTIASPYGTQTSDSLVEDATAENTHFIAPASPVLTPSKNYVVSIYAKKHTRDFIYILTTNKDNTSQTTWFNLDTGVLGATGHTSGAWITSEGGFYRCAVLFASGTGVTSPVINFGIAKQDNQSSYDGDVSKDIYIWGSQLEQGNLTHKYFLTLDKQEDLQFYTLPWKF